MADTQKLRVTNFAPGVRVVHTTTGPKGIPGGQSIVGEFTEAEVNSMRVQGHRIETDTGNELSGIGGAPQPGVEFPNNETVGFNDLPKEKQNELRSIAASHGVKAANLAAEEYAASHENQSKRKHR